MSKKVLIVLAEGFEEVEAITPIDVLRRAGVDVTVAGIGSKTIKAAHDVTVEADVMLEKFNEDIDAIILPGGMPGSENLKNSVELKSRILAMASEGKLVAAICAAPVLVLAPWGVLNGKKATCFPGMESGFPPEVTFSKEAVVQDGNIITSRGAGTAFAFALKIMEALVGRPKADMMAEQMVYSDHRP